MTMVHLNRWVRGLVASTLGLVCMASTANAAIYTLEDTGENTSVVIDTASGNMFNWYVDGIENLYERGWFIRVGAPSLGNPEIRVSDSNLDLLTANPFDINGLPGTEGLSLIYADPADRFIMSIVTNVTPAAPGSLQSTFTQNIRIDNTTNGALTVSLFLYADYDLLGSTANDTIDFIDPRSVDQISDSAIHQASVTVTPTFREVSVYPSLVGSLSDGDSTTLNNNLSLVGNDVTYGYQWDLVIPQGRSFTLGNTNFLVVPEVSTVTMLGIAAVGLAGARVVRRRK